MTSRRYDAVICDIDGCLQPEHHEPLDPYALAKIAEYNKKAQADKDRPVVTLCTGRPLPYAEAICRLIGNHTLPIIGEMGVWLWHPTDNRYDRDPAITPTDLHAIHEATEWMERELTPKGVSQQPGKSCSISLYHEDTDFLMGLKPLLVETFEKNRWPIRVSATWLWINCDLNHVSKASGIERFMAHTGLSKSRLAGIGDTPSDLAIREHVSFFACPNNANEDIKPHADLVATSKEIEGVLEILDTLIGA